MIADFDKLGTDEKVPIWQWGLDIIALLPVIGAVKYTDEVAVLFKQADKIGNSGKHLDELDELMKHADEFSDVGKNADEAGEVSKYADELDDAGKGGKGGNDKGGSIKKSGLNSPSECNISSKQFGKKWGKHKTDYPDLSMDEYKNLIDDVFKSPDKIIQDVENNEFLYLKGNNLLRVTNNGEFVSLYPGAESSRVLSAIEKGGTIWPK